jgi:hypothetical protein
VSPRLWGRCLPVLDCYEVWAGRFEFSYCWSLTLVTAQKSPEGQLSKPSGCIWINTQTNPPGMWVEGDRLRRRAGLHQSLQGMFLGWQGWVWGTPPSQICKGERRSARARAAHCVTKPVSIDPSEAYLAFPGHVQWWRGVVFRSRALAFPWWREACGVLDPRFPQVEWGRSRIPWCVDWQIGTCDLEFIIIF